MEGSLDKLTWKWRRLRRMSALEILYRAGKSMADGLAAKRGLRPPEVPRPDWGRTVRSWISRPQFLEADAYQRAAESVLSGVVTIFGDQRIDTGAEPEWNRDPVTGKLAPNVYGRQIDYRDRAVVGDIKYVWEINRHLQWTTVAQAYSLSGAERFLEGLARQLDSWLKQCPYPMGPNWSSSLELGIRLINWSAVWHLIGGEEAPIFGGPTGMRRKQRWVESIFLHCHSIFRNLSRFSSANNHLIGEAAGLFVATTTWPYWDQTVTWNESARGILEEELMRQNWPDGVNKEQAVSYQQFVLDFFVIAGMAGAANTAPFPDGYWRRIESMLEYLASIADVRGNVPMLGDGDDGLVVKLSQEPEFCPYRSLLATGAVLFGRTDLKKKAGRLDDKTRWLIPNASVTFEGLPDEEVVLPIRRAFPRGGYYILGTDFEASDEIRLIVDAGALGYRSIAAHGHADALAIYLSIGGREFLIDPGTYAYHGNAKWRNYFRGTRAHNTVRIDGQDQSVIGGDFMWTRHAEARCLKWAWTDQSDVFEALHDGYLRLPDPVLHQRNIALDKRNRRISVVDELTCKDVHVVERLWHFAEQCRVQEYNGRIAAVNDGYGVLLEPGESVDVRLVSGDLEGPLGWVARHYGRKTPTTTVVWRSEVVGRTSLETRIRCDRQNDAAGREAESRAPAESEAKRGP